MNKAIESLKKSLNDRHGFQAGMSLFRSRELQIIIRQYESMDSELKFIRNSQNPTTPDHLTLMLLIEKMWIADGQRADEIMISVVDVLKLLMSKSFSKDVHINGYLKYEIESKSKTLYDKLKDKCEMFDQLERLINCHYDFDADLLYKNSEGSKSREFQRGEWSGRTDLANDLKRIINCEKPRDESREWSGRTDLVKGVVTRVNDGEQS